MILRNKGSNTVKRYEGGWIVCTPGSTVTVSEEAGAYLLKAEPHQWEKVQEKGEEKSPPSPPPEGSSPEAEGRQGRNPQAREDG